MSKVEVTGMQIHFSGRWKGISLRSFVVCPAEADLFPGTKPGFSEWRLLEKPRRLRPENACHTWAP